MPQVNQTTLNIASTTVYASAQKAKILELRESSLVIHNPHETNGIKWKIQVSNEPQGAPDSWAEEKAEATLAPGATDSYTLSGPFVWVNVLIVDASGGAHGLANIYLQATGI